MTPDLTKNFRVELTSDTSLTLVRHFRATPDRVFRAMTDPDTVPKWYGLATLPMVSCEIDLKPGGRWRYVLFSEDAGEHAFTGTYRDINAPSQLVYTELYEPLGPDHETVVTASFVADEGGTLYHGRIDYKSKADRDNHIASGMEGGAEQSLDRLEAILSETQDS